MKKIAVTFDSNVWELLANDKKIEEHPQKEILSAILQAITENRVLPYISDVIITLEAIKKANRKEYHRNIKTKTTLSNQNLSINESKQDVITQKITIVPNYNHHTGLNEELLYALQQALLLGFKFINAPRIGALRLDESLYKPMEKNEQALLDRLNRTNEAILVFEKKGLGSYAIKNLGTQVINEYPELWNLGPFRAFSHSCISQKEISRMISEWADGDAIAAHYGHNHDIFCTFDQGKQAGTNSVMHYTHRSWLESDFNIKIFNPTQLAAYILSLE
ncbi:hypothetical protein [Chromobacterium vaccinii]|uniref:hypothetical protein n=1 Tax=Chromobacterium vaccinii TaxID=1108595 RepID=UPI0031D17179